MCGFTVIRGRCGHLCVKVGHGKSVTQFYSLCPSFSLSCLSISIFYSQTNALLVWCGSGFCIRKVTGPVFLVMHLFYLESFSWHTHSTRFNTNTLSSLLVSSTKKSKPAQILTFTDSLSRPWKQDGISLLIAFWLE